MYSSHGLSDLSPLSSEQRRQSTGMPLFWLQIQPRRRHTALPLAGAHYLSKSSPLEMPALRLNMSRRAFSYRAAAAWNRLPQSVTSAQTRTSFISILEDHVLPC